MSLRVSDEQAQRDRQRAALNAYLRMHDAILAHNTDAIAALIENYVEAKIAIALAEVADRLAYLERRP